jgi:hypothetical protein
VGESIKSSGSYIKPWTVIVYEALPGTPLWIGVGIAVVLLTAFLASRTLFDGDVGSSPGDFRMAIIHILLVAYTSSAYVYLLAAVRNSVEDLRPVIEDSPELKTIMDQVGTHLWWGLVLAGSSGILLDVHGVNVTTFGSDPWVWQQNNFDSRWMRILGPFFGWWMGCILYVLVIESARFSRLSDSIRSLDLLDLDPYQPLIRQGLTNALLVIGIVSVLSLFLFEPGFLLLMIQVFSVFAIFAWIGLMLPLRGIRRKINTAKEEELNWCRQALRSARDQLKSGSVNQQSIAEMVAYKTMIENIRNWPFDNPSLTRFALYLLIPVGSMIGGVLVERGLDFFFPG